MKQLFTILILSFQMACSFGQSLQLVKALAGGNTEPYDKNQTSWGNNEWNGNFFYQSKGSKVNISVTDGTSNGTVFLKEIDATALKVIIPAQDFVYLIVTKTTFELVGTSFKTVSIDEIWRSNGTTSGTSLVYTLASGGTPIWTSDRDSKRNFSVSGNKLYFCGYDATHGNELWVTDGTATGTKIVKDIVLGTANSLPNAFCKIGNEVYFSAYKTGLERKLWKTDGTEQGTVQIQVPEPFFIVDNAVGVVNNKMIFYAHNTTDGYEPYVSDGTPNGTFMLKDIHSSGHSWLSQSQNAHLRFNDRFCFFIANNGTANALWSTDGTANGTQQLTSDTSAVASGVSGGSYTDIDNYNIWLINFNGNGSSEKLYKSDGTQKGTSLVASELSYAQNLKIFKNRLWMAARDKNSAANVEPWASDGTNTKLMFEVAPGLAPTVNTPLSSNPFGFFVLNNSLYFFASSNTAPDLNLYKLDELATSLGFANSETEINIYPNPVHDHLTVKGAAQVFDFLGNKLIEGSGQINMSELSNGIYIVECDGKKTKITKY